MSVKENMELVLPAIDGKQSQKPSTQASISLRQEMAKPAGQYASEPVKTSQMVSNPQQKSRKRAEASLTALKRESRSSVTRTALSKHAKKGFVA